MFKEPDLDIMSKFTFRSQHKSISMQRVPDQTLNPHLTSKNVDAYIERPIRFEHTLMNASTLGSKDRYVPRIKKSIYSKLRDVLPKMDG